MSSLHMEFSQEYPEGGIVTSIVALISLRQQKSRSVGEILSRAASLVREAQELWNDGQLK